jgi:TolA-binding protein
MRGIAWSQAIVLVALVAGAHAEQPTSSGQLESITDAVAQISADLNQLVDDEADNERVRNLFERYRELRRKFDEAALMQEDQLELSARLEEIGKKLGEIADKDDALKKARVEKATPKSALWNPTETTLQMIYGKRSGDGRRAQWRRTVEPQSDADGSKGVTRVSYLGATAVTGSDREKGISRMNLDSESP